MMYLLVYFFWKSPPSIWWIARSTPNEIWTKLEVLFEIKEDYEYFMQDIGNIEREAKPSEDQPSYSEESSTQVVAQIFVPLITDDVYSISYFFSDIHVEYIWHTSHESHANTFPCTMHASQETKRETHTSDSIMIFSDHNLQKKLDIWISLGRISNFKNQIVQNRVWKVNLW